jgi:pimeloyl-ACP methyl ester carboxylesterase
MHQGMHPRDVRFTTDALAGVELHARIWGDAESSPIVLLHGGGANAHWWDHLAPEWARTHRVVALDFRGHGDSDHPEDHYTGAFQDDLDALLSWLGTQRVVLVGHSMGAHVALDHAARCPTTRGLVLIDPSRGSSGGSRRRARLALRFKRSYSSRETAIDRFRFLPPSEHVTEALRTSIAAASVRAEPDGRFGYKFDPGWFGLPPRTPPDPSKVACPALVVRGSESALLSADGARAFAEELPGAALVEIEGAGHHVLLDRPDALARAVAQYLEGLAPGG